MPDVWKFVDRPEAGATVLLDMNDRVTWRRLREGFDISPPPLRRSIATNNLTDGGLVTSASADLRELKFSLLLGGATEDARAVQLKALERELAKPANLLMHQPETVSWPVFFRTLRSDNPLLQYEVVPGKWQVDCSVLAEPYAIGIRHDILSGVVVTNDPAAASNPTRLDITGIRGDSPSPAFVRVAGGGAGTVYSVAQRTQNNPTALTVVAQCESGTLGTDTTVQANDATMSGAGSNFVRTTFSTDNNLTTRVTMTVPTASSGEAIRGRYRVFVKLRRSSNASLFSLRYQTAGGANVSSGPLTTYAASQPNTYVIDLGVVELPAPGPAPVTIGYSGLSAAYTALQIAIQARRLTGSLNLDMDYVYLLPADERQFSWKLDGAVETTILDGPQDTQYGMPASASPFGGTRTVNSVGALLPRQGGLPYLVPGVTNRWHVVRVTDDVTATSTWDISYWPRWREVATS